MNLPELLISCSSKDDELISQLDALLSQVDEELPLIYSTELEAADSSIIEEAGSQLRSQIATMADNIRSLVSDAGKSSLLRQMKSAEAGSLLCSDKLALCGIPHLVLSEEGVSIPLLIKTGSYPEKGVWGNDRLHLTALAMLMEETHSTPVSSGIVLYAIHAEARPVSIRPNDRRQVLKVLGRIRKIKEGSLPERKEGSLCQSCTYHSMCNVNSSLASKFF